MQYIRDAFLKRDILPEECSEDGIEVAINRISHKYGTKGEAYHGSHLNGVCVGRLMNDSEDILHEVIFC